MKRILLVGGGGFVGGHLVGHLQSLGGYDISITHNGPMPQGLGGVAKYGLDLLDPAQIAQVLQTSRPDCLVHLAAQSSVALSWEKPALTIDVNVKGTANLLEAVRASGADPRILLVGSGEEYGAVAEVDNPISEDHAARPGNPYAATKVAQELLGKHVMSVRAFNHVGPGQLPLFVVADFCKQVAEIEAGRREPVISVGNLSARRDFTDVRDVVRAYALLLERGGAGELYNVGSGHAVAIQDVLDMILARARCGIEVRIDEARFRPVDVPVVEADVSKLRAATGWRPEIPLERTVSETLDWWRGRTVADSEV